MDMERTCRYFAFANRLDGVGEFNFENERLQDKKRAFTGGVRRIYDRAGV